MISCSPLEIGRVEADGAAGNQRRNVDGILDRHGTAVVRGRRIASDRHRQRVAEVLVGDADGAV